MHRRRTAKFAALAATMFFAASASAQAQSKRIEGDAVRGAHLYELRCSACHSPDSNRIGPAHRGVFGRRAGSAPGYAYSRALARSGLLWDETTLDHWLTGPTILVPGTRMGISVVDVQDRRDIIAYLRTLRAQR